MNDIKSEFEKLEEVANIFKIGNFQFNEDEGNYTGTKGTALSYLRGAWITYQHQQSKVEELNQHIKRLESKLDSLGSDRQSLVGQVDELRKRLSELVKTLDQKADASWKEWKSKAEMHEQGLANAYWEASELLEQALKGGGE